MKISSRGRHGLTVMLELARRVGQGPVPLGALAAAQGEISAKYLEQLILPLKAAGLVKSVRGARGGYLLAGDAGKIRLHEVTRCMEGCTDSEALSGAVGVLWQNLEMMLTNHLADITLAELVGRQRAMEDDARIRAGWRW